MASAQRGNSIPKQIFPVILEMLHRSQTFTLPLAPTDIDDKSKKGSIFKGLLFALLSGVFYSLSAVIVKEIDNLDPAQLAFYRCISIFVFSLPSAVKSEENLMGPRNLRLMLFLRGIFGATTVFLNFVAFRYLPLGEAAVIIFSVPVFVTVAARVFLKEPCGVFQSVTVLMTVIGIILTTKIPLKLSGHSLRYTKETIYGMAAAVASLLFSTCRFIAIRKVKSVHHSIIMLTNGFVSSIETVVLTAIIGEFKWHDCHLQGLYIIALGIVTYLGQSLLTYSLQCELAGPVTTMRAASDIILAFVWQTVIFQDVPDALSISGAVLVGFSVIFVGLRKWASSLPAQSAHFKHLSWITK